MFRTELTQFPTDFRIDHGDFMLSMGSCFANDIGQRLHNHKFKLVINPGGILFNPLSIFELLSHSLHGTDFPEASYLISQERALNYKLHSSVSADSSEKLRELVQHIQNECREALKKTNVIIFTFGTAWTYRLLDNDMLVANCHKVPQSQFKKQLLSAEEITGAFDLLHKELSRFRPDIRVLLTVSPVRHIKDTIPLSSVSKSVLRLTCHQLEQAFSNVSYFPSYELMMDDLRDYRFYGKDLIHPNEQAVDYIWGKFSEACFTAESQAFVREWSSISASLNHRPFNPDSVAHQQFLRNTLAKVEKLSSQVDVSEELAFLRSQMTDR